VAGQSTCPFERFRDDFRSHYPAKVLSDPASVAVAESSVSEPTPRFASLPPEIGVLLIVVGVAGILLPGPVGSPFLVAGGEALWPAGFRKVERWLMKATPGLYEKGVQQMEQFLNDLERRYPGSVP
jgi:hypothetical protein